MMTSRSEYRLLLRQDNADKRLTPMGRELGLIPDERWGRFQRKQALIEQELTRIRRVGVAPSEQLSALLVRRGTAPLQTGGRLTELLRRPQLEYQLLAPFDLDRPELPADVCEQVEIEIKYKGYIKKQLEQVAQQAKLEKTLLPEDMEYAKLRGIRLEAREKLDKIRPRSVGQASRISGVTPADIAVLLILLEQTRGGRDG